MKVHLHQIRIPANYVLILPDPDFQTFQLYGEDTDFQVGNKDEETLASHYSVRGKVFAVPEKLNFNLQQIQNNLIPATSTLSMDEIKFFFRSQMVENMGYKFGSVLFDVPMEVKVGDIVYFNYQEHYACYEQARYVDTFEYGEMMLMKYDELICCHPEHDEDALTMLNGLLLAEVITTNTVYGKNVYERAGIFLADMSEETERVKKKTSIAYLTHWGTSVNRFLENSTNTEGPHDFKGGELIVFNPKLAPPLMFTLHRSTFRGMDLVKIRRRDIFCILPAEWNDELSQLASEMHLN